MTERINPVAIARARVQSLEAQVRELSADSQQKRDAPELWHSQWIILSLELKEAREELVRVTPCGLSADQGNCRRV